MVYSDLSVAHKLTLVQINKISAQKTVTIRIFSFAKETASMKPRKSFSLFFAACSSSLIAKDICGPCNNLQDRHGEMKMIEVERKVTKIIYVASPSYNQTETKLKSDRYFIGTAGQAYEAFINVYSDEKGNSGTCSKFTFRESLMQ